MDYKATEDDRGNNVLKKVTGSLHHLTITYEPEICFEGHLSYKTLPMTGSTGEVMAQYVYDALQEFDSLEALEQY